MSKYNYYPGGVQVNTQLKDGVTGAQVGGYWAGGNFVTPNADAVWSDDRGWMHTIYAGPPQPQDAANFESKEAKARRLRDLKLKASKRRDEIEKYITSHGEAPKLSHYPVGVTLCTTGERSIPYGGGTWFLVEPDAIWFIRNNGADGDDWSWNNLPGCMGWRVRMDQKLVDELKEIERVIGLEQIHDDVEEEIYRLFRW